MLHYMPSGHMTSETKLMSAGNTHARPIVNMQIHYRFATNKYITKINRHARYVGLSLYMSDYERLDSKISELCRQTVPRTIPHFRAVAVVCTYLIFA